MATRTASVVSVEILRGDDDTFGTTSRCRRVVIGLTNGTAGTVNAASGDTLQIADVGTSIASFTQDGLTYTLRAAAIYQNAVSGGTAYFGTLSLSSNQVDLTPKAVSDYSTNATLPSGAGEAPYQIMCFCTVA